MMTYAQLPVSPSPVRIASSGTVVGQDDSAGAGVGAGSFRTALATALGAVGGAVQYRYLGIRNRH